MVVSLCSLRSRRRSGSIEVPKRWSRRGLADGVSYSRPTGSVGTHGTNQRTLDTGSRNATPVHRAHREETGNIAFWVRTSLVLNPRRFPTSSCRSAAHRPSRVLPKPTSRQNLFIDTAFHEKRLPCSGR
mgnify:CR=1 FL=1